MVGALECNFVTKHSSYTVDIENYWQLTRVQKFIFMKSS